MTDLIRITETDKLIAAIKPSYSHEVRRFLVFAEDGGISLETYQAYIQELEDEGKAVSTVNKNIAACRAVIRKLFKSPDITEVQKWRLEQAIKEIPFRKKATRAVEGDKVLSPEEVEILISKSPTRTAALMRFLADTGVRISEALNVKMIDCRVDNGRTKIRIQGKGKKERTVRISTDLYNTIRRIYGGDVWLFESKSGNQVHDRNAAKEIQRLGLKHLHRHVTPHMFRHTFATNTIKRTGKRKAVSVYLGHSSSAITEDMYNAETLNDMDLGLEDVSQGELQEN